MRIEVKKNLLLYSSIISLTFFSLSCSNCSDKQDDNSSLGLPCTQNDLTAEICDDEIDNNCDGNTDIADVACACRPGETNKCWPTKGGPIENVIVNISLGQDSRLNGRCEHGRQICRALPGGGSKWGIWGEGVDKVSGTEDDIWIQDGCIDALLPEEEVCDDVDNDCNGRTDEGLKIECWSGPVDQDGYPLQWIDFYHPRENPTGVCKMGIKTCEQGSWSQCLHEVLPEQEECDNIDNDCDGVVDNNLIDDLLPCGLTDVGMCSYGYLICDSEALDMICQEYKNPQQETCNNQDDDCDGITDEDLFRPCETICASGFETCVSGSYQRCTARNPSDEICDGFDNDCDNQIDENLECSCPPELEGMLMPCIGGALTCGMGYRTCIEQDGVLKLTECCAIETYLQQNILQCIGGFGQPIPEECNSYDDNCNQEIDEELTDGCYTGPAGTRNVGECSDGEIVCSAGRWGNISDSIFIDGLCLEQVLPVEEHCNRLDDDCDGMIDEDLNAHNKVDLVFILDKSGSMCPFVAALTQGYAAYVMDFIGTEHRFAIVEVGTSNNQNPGLYNVFDFRSAEEIARVLAQWECNNRGVEPTYDAVRDVASSSMTINNLSFRNDAFPMIIMMTDETAQSIYSPSLTAANVVAALSPCQVGDCGNVNQLEVYAIVLRMFMSEWCEPANIAKKCYELYHGIDGETIRQYLEDIFSEVCV